MKPSSELKIEGSLIPWGYSLTFKFSAPLIKHALPLLIDGCINKLLAPEIKGGRLRDLKGVDARFIEAQQPGPTPPRAEELLLLSGKVPASSEYETSKSSGWDNFEMRLFSAFHEFIGAHHISHTVTNDVSGALPSFVELRDVGKVFPLEPNFFRCGAESFKSHFLGSLLGFAPTVHATFLLSADPQQVGLILNWDAKEKTPQPPAAWSAPKMLNEIIQSAAGVSIFDELSRAAARPT